MFFNPFKKPEKAKTYKIDYCGQKFAYKGAKDEYKAGEKVKLYYDLIATDTDYSFTLDDEYFRPDYSNSTGYVIEFTMPEHDVKLECTSKNTMINDNVFYYEPDTMLIDYYSATVATVGGDNSYELVLSSYTAYQVKLDVYTKSSPDADEVCVHYIVPYEVVDKCYELINKYDMRSWANMEKTGGMTGAIRVCKFRDGDSYVRVSTEALTKYGDAPIEEVRHVIEKYISDEYKV